MTEMTEYLDLLPHADKDAICALREKNNKLVASQKKGIVRFREPFEAIRHLRASHLDFSGEAVTIGSADELNDTDRQTVYNTLRAFMPWRKGPWSVFGIDIDAEWKSFRKWDRLLPEPAGSGRENSGRHRLQQRLLHVPDGGAATKAGPGFRTIPATLLRLSNPQPPGRPEQPADRACWASNIWGSMKTLLTSFF